MTDEMIDARFIELEDAVDALQSDIKLITQVLARLRPPDKREQTDAYPFCIIIKDGVVKGLVVYDAALIGRKFIVIDDDIEGADFSDGNVHSIAELDENGNIIDRYPAITFQGDVEFFTVALPTANTVITTKD